MFPFEISKLENEEICDRNFNGEKFIARGGLSRIACLTFRLFEGRKRRFLRKKNNIMKLISPGFPLRTVFFKNVHRNILLLDKRLHVLSSQLACLQTSPISYFPGKFRGNPSTTKEIASQFKLFLRI